MTWAFVNRLNADNKNIIANILGALFLKGFGMLLAVITLPLYLKYFDNNIVLGVWYTILTVLNQIQTLDMGVGNGLRNHLTIAISQDNQLLSKKLISTSYIVLGGLSILFGLLFLLFSPTVNWNTFFNVSSDLISRECLCTSVAITMIGILGTFFLKLIGSVFYALQKSAINNFISLVTSLLMVAYLLLVSPSDSVEENFRNMAIYYAVVVNIPSFIATVWVFGFSNLKYSRPSLFYFDSSCLRMVLGLGMMFLFLQILYMVISVTNEWFIARFFSPQYCVDYNIYNKLFTLIGSLYMLALTPLWSAVTKAYAEKRYHWIVKLNKILGWSVLGMLVLQLAILPFMQFILDLWIGKGVLQAKWDVMLIFVAYSVIINWIAVNSTIVAGMGTLKVQFYGYLFAAIAKVVGIVWLAQYTDNWVVVVLITTIVLLPYSIAQPYSIKKKLNKLINTEL